MKKKIFKGKTFWIILVLIVAVIGVVISRNLAKQQELKKSVAETLLNKSDVSVVKLGGIDALVNFTGDLIPVEQTIISAEVDARIVKVWVDEGQIVKAGQALADLDTLDLAQAVSQQEAALATAKVQLALSKLKMDKQGELLKQGFISQIAYDELVTSYKAAEQNYKAQDALLKRSKKQLSNTHVTAPFGGVIYQKNIEQGQLALKNTKLFALANLDKLEIKAAIPSEKINLIKIGQLVNFKVETDNQLHLGRVSRINQVAEPGTRSYMVYVNFDNNSANLKAGQFVKGQMILQSLVKQLVISCDEIREDNQHSYVLVLAGHKVVRKNVAVILQNFASNLCAIRGVSVGDNVLAGNVLSVKAGDEAKIVD